MNKGMKYILLIITGIVVLIISYFLGKQSTIKTTGNMQMWFLILCFFGTLGGFLMVTIGVIQVFMIN